MTKYCVSFEKNGVCQVNIVKSEKSPVAIAQHYRDVIKATYVYGIRLATRDDVKPSMPIVEI